MMARCLSALGFVVVLACGLVMTCAPVQARGDCYENYYAAWNAEDAWWGSFNATISYLLASNQISLLDYNDILNQGAEIHQQNRDQIADDLIACTM